MKIRTGFVSNSSSSSFLCAVKKETSKCTHCGRGDEPFFSIMSRLKDPNGENNYEVHASLDYFLEHAPEDAREELRRQIGAYKFEKSKWELVRIGISYHNQYLNDKFEEAVKRGDIIKFRGDN